MYTRGVQTPVSRENWENHLVQAASAPVTDAPNHPYAPRMGVVAFLAHNVIIGSLFGTAGVLLLPLQERLKAPPELVAMAMPMVMIGSAILASVVGVLAARYSLRILLAVAGTLVMSGWVLLAVTSNVVIFLGVYGLLFGPAMAIGGSVLPPTLVTRWFSRNRGLAIGLVHLPVVITLMPIAADWVMTNYGMTAAFLVLAVFAGVLLFPAAFLLQDHPPGQRDLTASESVHPQGAHKVSLTIRQLVRHPVFWCYAFTAGALNTSSVVLGVHLVAMGESWGIGHVDAVSLASIMSLVGMGGSVFYGWVADRLGGARTLALIALVDAVLWSLLLLEPPFVMVASLIGLIGMGGAGSIPALSKGIGESFGQEAFSRVFGFSSTVVLPLMIAGIVGFATVYRIEHNYTFAMMGMIAYFVLAVPVALTAARAQRVAATAA